MRPETAEFQIDFLPEDYKRRCQACRHMRPRCLVVVILAGAVVAVQWWLEYELARLRQVSAATQHVAKRKAELEAEGKRLREALATAEARAREFLRSSAWQRRSDIIAWLASIRPKDLWWEEIHIGTDRSRSPASSASDRPAMQSEGSVDYSQGEEPPPATQVRLIGLVRSLDQLVAYVKQIERHPATGGVQIVRLQADPSRPKCLEFEIVLKLSPHALAEPLDPLPSAVAQAKTNPGQAIAKGGL
ncbi:MAG: hypothetical protein NZ899_10715 [Thermoguttaceae bacterium]|nr:hypothetical protein [Thermoguttaceae bacterium]MDW8078940.1 hypothetical protein [Thermoguttaceae bacterium]